jgi:hypothetical protein
MMEMTSVSNLVSIQHNTQTDLPQTGFSLVIDLFPQLHASTFVELIP